MDSNGNLYGTTLGGGRGGCGGGCGIAYELKHNRRGWKERVLHDFYVIQRRRRVPRRDTHLGQVRRPLRHNIGGRLIRLRHGL